MSNWYHIVPLGDEMVTYLGDVGVAVPDWSPPSRDPTPQEIRTVCGSLTDFKVQVFSPPGHEWQLMIEGLTDPGKEQILLLRVAKFSGDESIPHQTWFETRWPSLILRIVRALSVSCGPLVIVDTSGCTPIVVTSDNNLDSLLASWERNGM
jgi:hypothetical protein